MNERVVILPPGRLMVGRRKLIRVPISLDALGTRAVWRVQEGEGCAVVAQVVGLTTVAVGRDRNGGEYGYFDIPLDPRQPGELVIKVASVNREFGNWRIEGMVTDPNGLANHGLLAQVTPSAPSVPAAPPVEEPPAPPPAAPENKRPDSLWQRLFRRG